MYSGSRFRLIALISVLITSSLLSLAQDPDEKNRFGKKDDPAAREQWFRKGRQTRNGKSPAEMLHKAYAQKMQMRTQREQQLRDAAQAKRAVPRGLAASIGTWTNLGPRPIVDSTTAPNGYGPLAGRITAIAVDQSDATGNTVFAAGAFGGVWKSTNAAAKDPTLVQWTPLTDDQSTLAMGSIALQPGNSNLILAGTGEPNYAGDSYYGVGILRSTDGGATWSTTTVSNDGYSFFGTGFGQIAFSTKTPNVVVAASSTVTIGGFYNAFPSNGLAGLWLSSNAGASWDYAPLTDDGTNYFAFSVSSVVYNAKEDKFYAAVPLHGVYVSQGTSSAGFTGFVRLKNQPGATGTMSLIACPTKTSTNCPMLRGALTARPVVTTTDPDEMYIWYVADGNGDSSDDQGIWKSATDKSGNVTWSQISDAGIKSCGDSYGCGTIQSFYNLYVSAVPNGSNTDLYAGTINIFKCSLSSANPTCSATPFQNLTHVYGCNTISGVHPDQHAIDFLVANPNIIYFGDDGGVNRTLTSKTNMHTGTCPTGGTKANAFDNLNDHIGPLSQFVWGSQHPTDPGTLMGGTQDNGTMAISPFLPAPGDAGWWEVNAGDGGYNWIDPVTPTNWYSAYTGVSIQKCTGQISCDTNTFLPIVEEDGSQGSVHQVDGDDSNFYTPYILDPAKPTQIIVGTCRVWRGSNIDTGWPSSSIQNVLSHRLGTTSDTSCNASAGDDLIQSLAAGGPSGTSGSKVIWAGTTGGHVYVTTNATTGAATWTDVTGSINPNLFPISGVALDSRDKTGLTAWVTIQGFTGSGLGHVWMTQNGGSTWADTGALPDAPVNDVAFDPNGDGILYAATDIGVYARSTVAGNVWAEVGPGPASGNPGYLPNSAVFHIALYHNGLDGRLRAWTHGRGAWETILSAPPTGVVADPTSLSFHAKPTVKTAPQTVTLTNLDAVDVTLGTPTITSPGGGAINFFLDPGTTTCGTTLAPAATCKLGFTYLTTNPYGGVDGAVASITTTGTGTPTVTIDLGALVTPLGVVATPTTLGFTSVSGVVSPLQSVTITNNDAVAVTLTAPTITGSGAADFAITTTPGQCDFVTALQPDQNCLIPVQFTPPSVGTYLADMTIKTSSTYTDTLDVSLVGTGSPTVSFTPGNLLFTSPEGTRSAALTVAVSNVGSTAVTLGKPAISGGNASMFSTDTASTTCGSSLAAGASCNIGFTFLPSAVGSFSTTANVTTDATGVPTLSIGLSGTGTTPTATGMSFDFGSNPTSATVTAGSSANYQFNVKTTPYADAVFSPAVTFACSGLPDKTACTFSPASLSSGGVVALSITTTAPRTAANVPPPAMNGNGGALLAAGIAVPGLALLIPGFLGLSRRKRLMMYVGMVLVLGAALGMTACGGGGGSTPPPPPKTIPGTPAGSYTVHITGTSGSVTGTQDVTLVVQ